MGQHQFITDFKGNPCVECFTFYSKVVNMVVYELMMSSTPIPGSWAHLILSSIDVFLCQLSLSLTHSLCAFA
jgi:hypothetical protein